MSEPEERAIQQTNMMLDVKSEDLLKLKWTRIEKLIDEFEGSIEKYEQYVCRIQHGYDN